VPIPLENKGEDLLTELKWYTTNWEGKGSTFLKICIQFKNGGEYLIAVFTNGHYVNGYHHFQFFVKIKNGEGEKCFFKNFKNMSGEDLEILEDYRKEMEIVVIPKNVIEDKERGIENFGLLTNFLNVNLGLSPDPLRPKLGTVGNWRWHKLWKEIRIPIDLCL